MVYAGTDDGEAEGRVDCGVEGECFERDVPLVMVHANERVCGTPSVGKEGCVWRDGALDADAFSESGADGGDDCFLFLTISEQAVFAGVRVEPEHSEERVIATDF